MYILIRIEYRRCSAIQSAWKLVLAYDALIPLVYIYYRNTVQLPCSSSNDSHPLLNSFVNPSTARTCVHVDAENSGRKIINVNMSGFPWRLGRTICYLSHGSVPKHSWEHLIDCCDKEVWSGICCTTMPLWHFSSFSLLKECWFFPYSPARIL